MYNILNNNVYKTRKVFNFSYVSKIFVEKQLKAVQRGKSTGLDDLPPGMIKDCAQELSQPLASITNLSINTGRIPSLWKKKLFQFTKEEIQCQKTFAQSLYYQYSQR